MRFWLRVPLRDGEKKEGDGGSGGNPPVSLSKDDVVSVFKDQIGSWGKSFKDELLKALKPEAKPKDDDDEEDDEPPVDPKTDDKGKKAAATAESKRIARLEKQLADEKSQRQEVERKREMAERNGALRGVLSEIKFSGKGGAAGAFAIFKDDVKAGEDGEFYGPDGETPLAEYISKKLETEYDDMLAPKGGGGAGAGAGKPPHGQSFTVDQIAPGMSKEIKAAATSELLSYFRGK